MKIGKIILGGVAGTVTFFILGWLVYGIILAGFSKGNYNQCAARPMEDMLWWAIIISNAAYAFLLAILFSWSKIKGVMAGIKIAAVVGLLYTMSMDLSSYSMTTMFANLSVVIIDILVYTLMSVIVGFVVAAVMVAGKKEEKM